MKALQLSRELFFDLIMPVVKRTFPQLLELGAWGRFGQGSECLGMDDNVSQDHDWGPRVDVLFPAAVLSGIDGNTWLRIAEQCPSRFHGYGPAFVYADGFIIPEATESFLSRTIGLSHAPLTNEEWLDLPEEDVVHVVSGEVWCDKSGYFSSIRHVFAEYYPDSVWFRRLAHWCRLASAMGVYAMHRAMLRGNWPYAFTGFGRALKYTMELVFLVNRRYFPYDKWLYPLFKQLPELGPAMTPMVEEAVCSEASWECRLELLEGMHTMLDAHMVKMQLVKPHPEFKRSSTEGYRILEWCQRDLLRLVPEELRTRSPQMYQKFGEGLYAGIVPTFADEQLMQMLNLYPK